MMMIEEKRDGMVVEKEEKGFLPGAASTSFPTFFTLVRFVLFRNQ
jgi:hypothetical protein